MLCIWHRQKGLVKKTKFFLLPKLYECFGNAVLGHAAVIEQIVLDDHVAVLIQQWRSVRVLHVDLIARVVLAWLAHRRKENRVIVLSGAQHARVWVIVPFLHQQHTGFCAGMRFEDVAVQPNHRQYAAMLGDVLADVLVRTVIETTLR